MSNAERQRAFHLRRKAAAGVPLTPKQQQILDEYNEKHPLPAARGKGAATARGGEASALERPSPSSSSARVPIHTTDAEGGASPESFAAVPLLAPPAAEEPAPGSPPPAAGAAPPPPPPGGPVPIVDEAPPPPPSPDALDKGAKRFAGIVMAINLVGARAAMELLPPELLEAAPEPLRDAVTGGTVAMEYVKYTGQCAYAMAMKHPILAASLPYEDEVVTLGSVALSIGVVFLKHKRDKDAAEGRPVVASAPPAAARDATPPRRPAKAEPAPEAAPPPNGADAAGFDFGSIKVDRTGVE